ncbi:MAG TPA: hypothetical protein VH598_15715 [Verrucomicrobiae bacterium]|jgi:hypothetical protein|nr:hypothetical protein [Verrucomicrobiae bacterium]
MKAAKQWDAAKLKQFKLSGNGRAVLDLMLQRADADGFVPWALLKKQGVAVPKGHDQIASAFRSSGRFAAERAQQGGGGVSPDEAEGLKETEKLTIEIIKHYARPNGTIDWLSAEAEHPGWRKKLSYNNTNFFGKARNILARFKRNGNVRVNEATGKLEMTTGQVRRAMTPQEAGALNGKSRRSLHPLEPEAMEAEVQRRLEALLSQSRFCARCGNDLSAQIMAANFKAKLS